MRMVMNVLCVVGMSFSVITALAASTVSPFPGGSTMVPGTAPLEPAVLQAAELVRAEHTRTVITEYDNVDDLPCLPTGKSYQIELQVKEASFDFIQAKIVYNWVTAKTITADRHGHLYEVCAD